MRRVVVDEWMSLDGVVQAPGTPEEDTSGGFQHGGWHLRYLDEMSQNWVVDYVTEAGGFLLGRRTYESCSVPVVRLDPPREKDIVDKLMKAQQLVDRPRS